MKIGVIIDNVYGLHIMKYLSKCDHNYYIYIDNQHSFFGEKKRDYSIENIKNGIQYLTDLGVEKIILPPIYELAFLLDNRYKNFSQIIANIYINYIKLAAKYSLVGKLGFIGDWGDFEFLDIYISEILSDFTFSENQKKIKKFCFPFLIYKQNTHLRKYLLQTLSPNSHIINHTLKTDLRKLSSCNIDTLLPLNYAYFANTKSIKHNLSKTKFHNIDFDLGIETSYCINIYITGKLELLLSEKKWKWLLCRGKSIERNINHM